MGDNNDEDLIVNYDMLNSVNNEYTLSEKMVLCVGGHILPESGMACKATLVFHNRATVCQMKPTTKARRRDATLVEYNGSAIDKTHFSPDIICYSRHSFKENPWSSLPLHCSGRHFLDLRRLMRSQILNCSCWYFMALRGLMRSQILPLFSPTNLRTIELG
jgi:hypothetical protein